MIISLSKIKELISKATEKIKNLKLEIGVVKFSTLYSLLILIIFNKKFFNSVYLINNSFLAVVVSFMIIACIYNILFNVLFQRKLTKFFSILFLLISANILYFMNAYNTVIDKVMLLNVKETNIYETLELLSFRLFLYIFLLAVLPSILIIKTKINYGKFKKEILFKVLSIFISLLIGATVILISYKGLSSTVRQNKRLKHILIPFNYIDANFGLVKQYIKVKTKYKFQDITTDVQFDKVTKNNKKNLVVFVVGEAARDKNWSLSNYERDTNKYLKNQNLIYFNNTFSCGTSTAISVPCIFSVLSRKDFDIDKRDAYSNLLDFLNKANFNILWRENNSDCKGVCTRYATEDFIKNKTNKKFCNKRECFDEVLIDGLQEKINSLTSENNFIVLHQKGSHGPAYYLRYPKEFEKFKPTCKSEYFNHCTNEEIVNTYDNTLNYTSYVLNKLIEILKANENNFNVAVIYASDHGQSLGENGMYLHGAPYMFSPIEQRHVPFFMWFSKDFENEFDINEKCLKNKTNLKFSHDNLFHSVLGLFNIHTKYYNDELDIFKSCRSK